MTEKGFKLVNMFLFSESYEKELLYLKLFLENNGVDEWVILENSYTLQGEWKGFHARNVLYTDDRFKPYLDKITIIEKEYVNQAIPRHVMMDTFGFKAEHVQRDFGYDHFVQHYGDNDWVQVSDVDEMLDFTDPERYHELVERLQASATGLEKIPTQRYWYDFDNAYLPLLGLPICTRRYLLTHRKKLSQIRFENRCILKKGWKHIIQFEYSSCFGKEHLLRKIYSGTHTGLGPEELEKSLLYNHRPVNPAYIDSVRKDEKFFFERVTLTPGNSPAIVRENLSHYKTNVVDQDYARHRKTVYAYAFTFRYRLSYRLQDARVYCKKKFRFLLRRMGIEHFFYPVVS